MLALLLIKEQRVAPYRFDWRSRKLVRRVAIPAPTLTSPKRNVPNPEKQDETVQKETAEGKKKG